MTFTRLRNYHTALLQLSQPANQFADLDVPPNHGLTLMRDVCPCITRRRALQGSIFSFQLHRFLTLKDMIALQGFPKDRLAKPPNVSEQQFGAMVGNAMDVRVVMALLAELLRLLGWRGGGAAGSQKRAASSQKGAAASTRKGK